jgi:poly(3-hydroxybutyrate) depolymerase
MKEKKSLKPILLLAVTASIFIACSNSSSGGASGTGGSGGGSATGGVGGAAGVSETLGGSGAGGSTIGASGTGAGAGGAGTSGSGGVGGTAGTDVVFDGGSGNDGGGTSGTGGTSATGGTGGTPGTVAPGTLLPGNDPVKSAGCGHNNTLNTGTITTQSGRQYMIDIPTPYDNNHPYRLIFGLHGAMGSGSGTVSSDYFGLKSLSAGSTIFVALDAVGGIWSEATDATYAADVLKAVEDDLCIDTTRIMLEGFSQGGAMAWVLACSNPGVYRVAIGHSGGSPSGVTRPTTCGPIAYLGSLGLSDISGNSQATQTDQFANWDGCTVETLPTAPAGGHVCTNYSGCPAATPVRWCSFDGIHTPSPADSGQVASWMPSEVWAFVSPF